MFLHLIEWSTCALGAVTTVGVSRWLYMTARYPYSWNRPVPAPKEEDYEFVLFRHDTTGLV